MLDSTSTAVHAAADDVAMGSGLRLKLAALVLALVAALCASTTTHGQGFLDGVAGVGVPLVDAELIAQHTAIVPGQTATLGLRMKMKDHWHTYWRNPGDSGLATSIEWDLPEGFVAHDIDWPTPQYFEFAGLATFGYEGEIVLPVRIDVPEQITGETITFKANADWLVCKEECVTGGAELSVTLPVVSAAGKKATPDPRWAELFAWAKQRQAHTTPSAEAQWVDGQIRITVPHLVALQPNIPGSRFFPFEGAGVSLTAEQNISLEPVLAETPGSAEASGSAYRVTWVLKPELTNIKPPATIRGVLALDTSNAGRAISAYEINVRVPTIE